MEGMTVGAISSSRWNGAATERVTTSRDGGGGGGGGLLGTQNPKRNPKTQNPKTPKPNIKTSKPQNHLVRLMACDSDRDYFTASKAKF